MSFSRLKEELRSEGFPEIPRESRGVKGLGRVIGVFYHLLWTHQRACSEVHNAIVMAQHSTPRCALSSSAL